MPRAEHQQRSSLTCDFRLLPQLRLTSEQAQEKEGIEASISELKEGISLEEDDEKKATLEEELKAGQEKLDALMDSVRVSRSLCFLRLHAADGGPLRKYLKISALRYRQLVSDVLADFLCSQKLTLEAAARGEIQRPSERRAALEQQQQVRLCLVVQMADYASRNALLPALESAAVSRTAERGSFLTIFSLGLIVWACGMATLAKSVALC